MGIVAVLLLILGGVVGLTLLIVLSSMLNGYVLSVLWGWFMVPTFGLPPLSIAPAIGLAIVVGYLTRHASTSCKEDDDSTKKVVTAIVNLCYPLIALGVGWVVHLFM